MYLRCANVAQLHDFDEIIDVRTPAEFAEDHIPGAINCPVLSDEERVRVGTLHTQVSPFEARKLGAALISNNVSRMLQERFVDRPKSWKPLIYCWRGGMRSASANIVFTQVGWASHQLEGGYKAYRHEVLRKLEELPGKYTFVVICGPTGCGKSRLLSAIAETGQQILDLEHLANHRGSVLGLLPGQIQPSQKWFDSQLLAALEVLDPAKPVYVEVESNKIGAVKLPESLSMQMHQSQCLMLEAPLQERVRFLIEDYPFYCEHPESLITQLQILKPLYSKAHIERWAQMAISKRFEELVSDLLTNHYDPAYKRSLHFNYRYLPQARQITLTDVSPESLRDIAENLVLSAREIQKQNEMTA